MTTEERPTPPHGRPAPTVARSSDSSVVSLRLGGPALDEAPFGVCTEDPDRWAVTADEGAQELCRACPRRWACAQEACQTPGAEGV